MSTFVSKHAYRSLSSLENESNARASRKSSEELPSYSQATKNQKKESGLVSALKDRWNMHDAEYQIQKKRSENAHGSVQYTR